MASPPRCSWPQTDLDIAYHVARLLRDPGIVRNRLKVESAVTNARAFLEVRKEYGSFDAYLWRFGSTICYAFMQAVGMVNDHLVTRFRYRELNR